MKNSILVFGYADAAGNGRAVATDLTADDFEAAKREHKFPKGVKHLKMFSAQEIDCAIFIGDTIGDAIENAAAKKAEADKSAAAKKAQITERDSKIAAAQKKVQDTARVRNELMGKLHSAKVKLANHDATPDSLRGKSHNGAVSELQKLILGDPEKKVAGLEAQVAEAIALFNKASEEYNALVAPLNNPPSAAPKSQFVEA